MKRLFQEMLAFSFSMVISSCVFDTVYPIYLTNHTKDTILIGYAHYNTIDSVKTFLPSYTGDTLAFKSGFVFTEFNGKEKLSIGKHDLIPPDSTAGYHEPHPLFFRNQDQAGYFFIINLETARQHT